MTAVHAPEFITDHPDRTVRSILYVCWVATFNTPEHHMGLPLAQTQVRCLLFACNDGRNAEHRDEIDVAVADLVSFLGHYRAAPDRLSRASAELSPVRVAERLCRLRELAVTP